ncbi:hypothetical protein [Capnocytophaga canimorsus]|uniref:hypothetical protein n=1 Tax=Capnocytophaga canimorsus TaxID=28188 RepID=UPI001EE0F602|nr:hypothetical protein [Capnocytophaga canimorsus]GJQ04371.1 hypothetical protein CAPN009_07860 [Capnocytophaga canimorsus]
MLKILKPSVRITEMADTAKQLVMLYKNETALANDPICVTEQVLFAQNRLVALLTEVRKPKIHAIIWDFE